MKTVKAPTFYLNLLIKDQHFIIGNGLSDFRWWRRRRGPTIDSADPANFSLHKAISSQVSIVACECDLLGQRDMLSLGVGICCEKETVSSTGSWENAGLGPIVDVALLTLTQGLQGTVF